jgi:hypothetical protein
VESFRIPVSVVPNGLGEFEYRVEECRLQWLYEQQNAEIWRGLEEILARMLAGSQPAQRGHPEHPLKPAFVEEIARRRAVGEEPTAHVLLRWAENNLRHNLLPSKRTVERWLLALAT